MKTPKQYKAEAARLRGWGFGILLLVPVAVVGIHMSAHDREVALKVMIFTVSLLCGAGIRLIARARRQDQRAITEDWFRSKEARAVARRHYPPTIAPLGRP